MNDTEHAAHNRRTFDDMAARYNTEPWQRDLSAKVIGFIASKSAAVLPAETTGGGAVRLLDYACGTGVVTTGFAPYITEAIGVDISPKMVERYNDSMRDSLNGKDGEKLKAHAVEGDLFSPHVPEHLAQSSEMSNFDIAAIGLGFHHFANFPLAVSRLKDRLKSGGSLVIIDFVDDAVELPSDSVKVHGFSQETMSKLFKDAGLVDAQYDRMSEHVEMRHQGKEPITKQIFLASARKP